MSGTDNELMENVRNAAQKTTPSVPAKNNIAYPVEETFGDIPALRDFIISANNDLGLCLDWICTVLWTVAGAAIGNSVKLYMKDTWREASNIYSCIVGHSGEAKTPLLKLLFAPFEIHKLKNRKDHKDATQEFKAALLHFKTNPERFNNIEPEPPKEKLSLIGAHTIEGLISALVENPKGLIHKADEFIGFLLNMNRYNKGSDLEFYLSLWSNDGGDRLTKTEGAKFAINPHFSICGGTQVGKLPEMVKTLGTTNGAIDRVILAFPDTMPKDEFRETDVPHKLKDEYNRIIGYLINMPAYVDEYGVPQSDIIHFTPAARILYKDWYNNNARLKEQCDNQLLKGIYSKFTQYVAKFALIKEMLKHASGLSDGKHVGESSIKSAIAAIEYHRATAIKFCDYIAEDNPIGKLPKDVQELYSKLPQKFKAGQADEIAFKHWGEIPKGTVRSRVKALLKRKELFMGLSGGNYEKLNVE